MAIDLRIFSAFFHKMIPVFLRRKASFLDDFCGILTSVFKGFWLVIEMRSDLWYNFHYLKSAEKYF
ncbi:MAG: hypothetical protein HFJ84_00365 [Clostridiales bacterium]|nr:hypothetical protein [Clostridiales bacterium]